MPCTILQDSGTEFEGLKIWGSPWSLTFPPCGPRQQPYWAFNLSEEELAKKWKLIPSDTDILVLHSPVYGYGDEAPRMNSRGFENVGSPSLLAKIKEMNNLYLTIFGHIHDAQGKWNLMCKNGNRTILANVVF